MLLLASWILCILLILYIFSRITCGYTRGKLCLVGKTAIVTGGNSGIGYQAALGLASRGCRVIIADKIDASKARDSIIKKTTNPNVLIKHLDLASFESVRSFAKDINENENKIDILINNVGIGASPVSFTEDGLQLSWQVNHYGAFLLTHLLIGVLKRSAPSRIIFTSSLLAYFSSLSEKDLKNTKESYNKSSISASYFNTKLCIAMCTKIFAEKLAGTGVTCNVLHPGFVYTPIFLSTYRTDKDYRSLLLYVLGKIYAKSAEEGAQTTLHLSVANEVRDVSGKMFWDCKQFFMPSQVNNVELCKRVWQISEELCGLQENEKLRD